MSDTKCWWRYNNMGGRYKTCEINQYKGRGVGRPVREVPRLTPEEFVEKIGVDYSDMKKAQRNEYHRLDMAERRREEREIINQVVKERKAKKDKSRKLKKKVKRD